MGLRTQVRRLPALLHSDSDGVRLVSRNGNLLLPLLESRYGCVPIVPRNAEGLLFVIHIERDSEAIFRVACCVSEHDLEGIVAKHRFSPYIPDAESTWLKIRNTEYSQWVSRKGLFERERARQPDAAVWDGYA